MKRLVDLVHLSQVSDVLVPIGEDPAFAPDLIRSQLLGALSHEVIQPVTAIALNAEAALRWLKKEPANLGEARQAIVGIIKDSHRAGDIVRGLRNLTRTVS